MEFNVDTLPDVPAFYRYPENLMPWDFQSLGFQAVIDRAGQPIERSEDIEFKMD